MLEPACLGIVVPTHNEAGNIQTLLASIASELGERKNRWFVIIVDDNSTDGTIEAVEKVQNESEFVHMIKRPRKMGLGSAYKDGFAYAIDKLKCEVLMEMDADFSHSPKHINDFLRAINNGYQVVVGSRKVPGGAVENWTTYRRLLSYGANWLARSLLGLPVHDGTSGFRAYTRSALQEINYRTIKARGFDFQVETLFRAHHAGLRITEIPITFRNRKKARSKLKFREIATFFRTCLRLWNERIINATS